MRSIGNCPALCVSAEPTHGCAPIASNMPRASVRIVASGVAPSMHCASVREDATWATASTLLHFILGVAAQNAAHTQLARARGIDRSSILDALAAAWTKLDPHEYPFVRSMAAQMRVHDDRIDFIAGIDLILKGIESPRGRSGVKNK